MDKWTWFGFLITAAIAVVGYFLVRSLLVFFIDHWPWILIGVLAVVIAAYTLAVRKQHRPKS
jgi:hypothetical protein